MDTDKPTAVETNVSAPEGINRKSRYDPPRLTVYGGMSKFTANGTRQGFENRTDPKGKDNTIRS
jgi:hypothetical protein